MKTDIQKAISIIHTLRARGHQALLAGGCVRDKLLGVTPKDYDIATSARPMNVQSAFERTEAIGAAFGVILVVIDGSPFEVATFRSDGPYSDGRHPDTIAFTSPKEDALRRDFTVNAMFYDVDQKLVLDFVGGQADLKAKIIRSVGDPAKRFEEDKLRLLRCVRFAAQLGFEIEKETYAQLKNMASQINQVAWERLLAEMNALLSCGDAARGIELMRETGLLEALLPELLAMVGNTQTPRFHPEGDVWVHTMLVIKHLNSKDPHLMWAGLLHDIGKPATWSQDEDGRIRNNNHELVGAEMAEVICRRFRMSSDATTSIVTLVADHLRFNPIREMKESKLKRLLRRDDIENLFALHKADCLASHGGLDLYDYARQRQKEFLQDKVQVLSPPALITGHDLLALGMQAGPIFKEILAEAEDEQLEGRLLSREKALRWLQSHPEVIKVTAK